MVSRDPYELCLYPRVAKGWRQKEIKPFVSETTVSACIIIIIIIIIIEIIMCIQHLMTAKWVL